MALKPRDSKKSDKIQVKTYNEASLVEGIYTDQYILVVGSSIVLDREQFPDSKGDLNAFVLNTINNERDTGVVKCSTWSEIIETTFQGEVSPIYDLLVNRIDYEVKEISPELRELLQTYLFKFVFSTTPDHYLETLMKQIWGKELRVVNISDRRSLQMFSDELKASLGDYHRPTLFYVFGKATEGHVNPTGFMENDQDAILFIEQWMKLDKDYEPIVSFLKEKRLLGVGCDFDDWYFRFFWYILTRDIKRPSSRIHALRTDNVVMGSELPSLKHYMKSLQVCIHDNPWKFMDNLKKSLPTQVLSLPIKNLLRVNV